MSKFFKYFQALSLDIVLGGIAGSIFISAYMGVRVDPKAFLILGAVIWLIYTLDHLLDTKSAEDPPITFRHRFHWENYTNLWGIWSFTLVMCLSALYKLPRETLIYGAVLGLMVVGYFVSLRLFKHRNAYHKEGMAAFVYSAGIFIPAVSIMPRPLSVDEWLLFVELFSLAWANLLIFSLFERMVDREEGYKSLVLALNTRSVRSIIWGLLVAILTISIVSSVVIQAPKYQLTQVIFVFMNLTLMLIVWRKDYFLINTRYRILGDAIFLFPLAYMLFIHVV